MEEQQKTEQPQQDQREGGERRGFGRGRGGDRGGRGGRPGGDRRGGRPGGDRDEWIPATKLGRLVKYGHIKVLEEIYTHSIPIKEAQIVDTLLRIQGKQLSEEVMKILSVQKQTKAGQRTRFKAIVALGDQDGHVGLGVKVAKEVQVAIKGALVTGKLSLVPVRRGYWGNKIGDVHTVPLKVKGKCGSVRVRLVPAPRGTGIVGAPVSKRLLQFAGIQDCYTCSTGKTRTVQNFATATFKAIAKTYSFLTPDLWTTTKFIPSPFMKHADKLEQMDEKRHQRGGERRGRGDRGRGGRGRGGSRGRGGRGQRSD